MELEKLIALCIIGAITSLLLKSFAPTFSPLISVFVSVCVIGVCVYCILPFVEFYNNLVQGTSFSAYASVLFRVCGIATLSGFAAEICRDAGESVFASKTILAGKTAILLCALPILKSLIEQVKDLLS